MQILFAIVALFWWIAVWGLKDLLIEHWTKQEKMYFYLIILALIGVIVWRFPHIVGRF
jgi:hypothetical protein